VNPLCQHGLKWLNPEDIADNVKYLLPRSEKCLSVIDRFSIELDEIRVVRNHAAHRVNGTKEEYRKVLQRYYGSSAIAVPVGKFLVSERFGTPPVVVYAKITRTLVKELCAGP
jgi:hypothetical protein